MKGVDATTIEFSNNLDNAKNVHLTWYKNK